MQQFLGALALRLLHEHPLVPASFSADQHASVAWNLELGCKEVEQRRIRGAFDGARADSHFERVAVKPLDLGNLRSRSGVHA